MVKQKLWDQTDRKHANKLAINTKLEVLESSFNTSATKNPRGATRGSGCTQIQYETPFIMPDWKKINKGDTIERYGDTIHLCKHHVHTEGLWDGVYMSHKSEYHDQ